MDPVSECRLPPPEEQGPAQPVARYDLVVIGSGPAGQAAASEAGRRGLSVAVVERQQVVGGICLHTGTMPSKALRHAVLRVTGMQPGTTCPSEPFRLDDRIWMDRLKGHIDWVIGQELAVIECLLRKHRVAMHYGSASFLDAHTLRLTATDGTVTDLTGDRFLIATGSEPVRIPGIPFDDETVIVSDDIYRIDHLPATLLILGGGVIAMEYASIFALLGIRVTVVTAAPDILPFLDADVLASLKTHLLSVGVRMRAGRSVLTVESPGKGSPHRVTLDDGTVIDAEMIMAASGRGGLVRDLGLERIGLVPNARGHLAVDVSMRTTVPHVWAAGDVTGPPATASSAKVQGRQAALAMTGTIEADFPPPFVPVGIYTVPEIAFAGASEAELQRDAIPFVSGLARFREVAKGEIIGDQAGLVKLLFHSQTRRLLGVHLIGTDATEIVHFGLQALQADWICDHFLRQITNYPTLTEAYKIAALDAALKFA
jgi:NAD(P) transhydrogenase